MNSKFIFYKYDKAKSWVTVWNYVCYWYLLFWKF